MTDCPSKDCHENIALTLKSKVSWKSLFLFVGLMCGFIIAGLNAWDNAKDERKENQKAIALIQCDKKEEIVW